MVKFNPQLALKQGKWDLDTLFVQQPQGTHASIKKDGIRAECGESSVVSRELEDSFNIQVTDLIKSYGLCDYEYFIELEIYIHGWLLSDIQRIVLTRDINTKKHQNKIRRLAAKEELNRRALDYLSIPKNIEFYLFDIVIPSMPEAERYEILKEIYSEIKTKYPESKVTLAEKVLIKDLPTLEAMYEKALADGFEGLILNNPDAAYHFNRSGKRLCQMLKMTPSKIYEGVILGVNERMENTTESHKNNRGKSVKRKLKDNMVGQGIAATFSTEYEGHQMKVTIGGTEALRKEIWENKESYIGKTIQFKGLAYGGKNVPRNCSLYMKHFDTLY